jgi:hypothetical protein
MKYKGIEIIPDKKADYFSWTGFFLRGKRYKIKKGVGKMFLLDMSKNKDGTYKYFDWVPLEIPKK